MGRTPAKGLGDWERGKEKKTVKERDGKGGGGKVYRNVGESVLGGFKGGRRLVDGGSVCLRGRAFP